jgi:hypothetical protein
MKDSRSKGEPPPVWSWELALKTAILIGLTMNQFDEMTPYELALYSEAYAEKEEAMLKERLTLVWLGEYYHRAKRLPKLQDELKKVSNGKKEPMSPEQMLRVVQRLNKQFGGTVIKGGE